MPDTKALPSVDPSIVAMRALLQGNTQGVQTLFDQLSANLTKLTKMYQASSKFYQDSYKDHGQKRFLNNNNPDWVYEAPTDLSQQRTFRGRVWTFCMKCGRHGKWVYTHTNSSHWFLTTIVEEAAIKMILTNTTSEMVAHREQNDRVSFTAVTWMAADPDPELLFQHEGAPLYTTEATVFLSNKPPHLAHPQSCPRLTLLMLSSLMIERDGFL